MHKSFNEVTGSSISRIIECVLKFNPDCPQTGRKSFSSAKNVVGTLPDNGLELKFLEKKFDTKVYYKKDNHRKHCLVGVRLTLLAATFSIFKRKERYPQIVNTCNPVLMTRFLKSSVVTKWVLLWTITFIILWFNSRVLWNYSLFHRCLNVLALLMIAFYPLYWTFLRVMSFHPFFGLLKSKTIQDNPFLIIICLVIVSPKCVGCPFDDFPVFYEWLICAIEGLLRIHFTISVWKEEGNQIFLHYLLRNSNIIHWIHQNKSNNKLIAL